MGLADNGVPFELELVVNGDTLTAYEGGEAVTMERVGTR